MMGTQFGQCLTRLTVAAPTVRSSSDVELAVVPLSRQSGADRHAMRVSCLAWCAARMALHPPVGISEVN